MFKFICCEGKTSKKLVNACHAKHPENFQETVFKTYVVQKHSFNHQACLSCNNKDKIANCFRAIHIYQSPVFPDFFTHPFPKAKT